MKAIKLLLICAAVSICGAPAAYADWAMGLSQYPAGSVPNSGGTVIIIATASVNTEPLPGDDIKFSVSGQGNGSLTLWPAGQIYTDSTGSYAVTDENGQARAIYTPGTNTGSITITADDYSHNVSHYCNITVVSSAAGLDCALQCPDGWMMPAPISGLIVTAGTSQFNAGGVYHSYVRDSNLNVDTCRGVRVDFVNGTPPVSSAGQTVSVMGEVETTSDGERAILVDLSNSTHYKYSVSGSAGSIASWSDNWLSDIGCNNLEENNGSEFGDGLAATMVTRPAPAGCPYNLGQLVHFPYGSSADVNFGCEYQVTYVDTTNKFAYVDDGSFHGYSPSTDGNGLLADDVCANGVRVDWSWMTDTAPTLNVGDYVTPSGIAASMYLQSKVPNPGEDEPEIVRVLRLRQQSDLQTAPVITSPSVGQVVPSVNPTITWTNPPWMTQAAYQLGYAWQTGCGPATGTQYFSEGSVVQSSDSSGQLSGLAPGAYDVFVRVGSTGNGQDPDFTPGWSPWSAPNHVFTVDTGQIIYPVNGSTIQTTEPTLIWTSVKGTSYDVRILDPNSNVVWSAPNISGNSATCTHAAVCRRDLHTGGRADRQRPVEPVELSVHGCRRFVFVKPGDRLRGLPIRRMGQSAVYDRRARDDHLYL